jgi:NTP pyrophosphatase (non-canonical NTP hydrolase)
MDIKEVSQRIYENNVAKGFWDEKRNIGEMLMLVVSELSEGLEADRKKRFADVALFKDWMKASEGMEYDQQYFKTCFEKTIKDTFEDEIADAVIRLFDIAYGLGIDLPLHIDLKMKYNVTRQRLHGKAY